jgi:hypothetical protein
MFDPSEKWEEFLRMIESLPDFLLKEQIILRAKELIAEKAKGNASK